MACYIELRVGDPRDIFRTCVEDISSLWNWVFARGVSFIECFVLSIRISDVHGVAESTIRD